MCGVVLLRGVVRVEVSVAVAIAMAMSKGAKMWSDSSVG